MTPLSEAAQATLMNPVPIVHLGLTVPDIDRAVEWYSRVLGFDVLCWPATLRAGDGHAGRCAVDVFGAGFGELRLAQLVAGNGVGIELFQFLDSSNSDGPSHFDQQHQGIFHFCVRAADVDALIARICDAGGRQRTPVHDSFEGEPYRWCYCEDPFGNLVEIYSHSHEQVYANRSKGTLPPPRGAFGDAE